ncbi:MAG TPA: ferredoxin family protein [candidate division Zixibacteria bacterium]|nr:ferredoxin family protein [candidate division Zixibacteria bacterium]
MHTVPIEGRIRSGLTTAAPTTWGESVRPQGKLVFFEVWCKRCRICVEFCPTGALAATPEGMPYLKDSDKCTLCGLCWLRCPDMAIIKGPELPENQPTEDETNRTRKLLCEAGDETSCPINGENGGKKKHKVKKDEAENAQ